MPDGDRDPGFTARRLMRAVDRAALATAHAVHDGWPYASLVLVAVDHDASPILLLSDLADHTRNIAAGSRVSLLFDGTGGGDDPLAGARVSVLGCAEKTGEPRHRWRFLARHPTADVYADFRDFNTYRVTVERAHLVAGFGRIHWLDAEAILYEDSAAAALAQAEPDIVAHMNEDHGDALALFATALSGHRVGEGWAMTGIDPEGCDLRRGGEVARIDFENAAVDAESARRELVRLTRRARAGAGGA